MISIFSDYMSISTDRIDEKIAQLVHQVRRLDEFDQSTSINAHELLCFIRLAIWEDEEGFIDWLKKKTHEVNPNVLSRLIIHEADKDESMNKIDGVELRFHIFKDGNETFKHNHRQDFITIPLLGAYDYTWWKVDREENGMHYEWMREKGGKLSKPIQKKGLLRKAILGDQEGRTELIPGGKEGPSGKLQAGEKPMFVRNDWHHTVRHHKEKGPMITFVVRRGKQHPHATVLSTQNDAEEGNDFVKTSKKGELKQGEMEEIRTDIIDALRPYDANEGRKKLPEFTDLEHYITPINRLLCMNKSDIEHGNELQKKACLRLMKTNDFSFIPLLDQNLKCSDFLASGLYLEHEPMEIIPLTQISKGHHILSALLWAVGLRKFVVPVESNGSFAGILSLENVLTKEFEASLLLSLTKMPFIQDQNKKKNFLSDRLVFGHKLLLKMDNLYRDIFTTQTPGDSATIDEHIHEILLSLGPLIVMAPRLDIGYYTPKDQNEDNNNLGSWGRFPMFQINVSSFDSESELEIAEEALRLMEKGNNYSQLALVNQNNHRQLLSISHSEESKFDFVLSELSVASSTMEFPEIMEHFAKNKRPLFVRNSEGELGIFTIYELKEDFLFKKFYFWAVEQISKSEPHERDLLALKLYNLSNLLFDQESNETEIAFTEFCSLFS